MNVDQEARVKCIAAKAAILMVLAYRKHCTLDRVCDVLSELVGCDGGSFTEKELAAACAELVREGTVEREPNYKLTPKGEEWMRG